MHQSNRMCELYGEFIHKVHTATLRRKVWCIHCQNIALTRKLDAKLNELHYNCQIIG